MDLPINYNSCTQQQRRLVREEYIRLQRGLCYHCKNKLDNQPSKSVRSLPIDTNLFPPNFFKSPVHLHHSHETGMTIGAVHCYCNAVLWQYYLE